MGQLAKYSPIGLMDERITLKSVTEGTDDYGGATRTVTTQATVWAAREYKPSDEEGEAMKETAYNKVVFIIRKYTGVAPTWIITASDGDFEVMKVEEHKRRYMRILAEWRQ